MAKSSRDQDRKRAAATRRKTNNSSIRLPPGAASMPPEELAQELVWDAIDAPTPKQQLALLTEALRIHPGNLEARRMILDYSKLSPYEQIPVLRELVELNATALGPEIFVTGHKLFWGLIETRPYMRARHSLAFALRSSGQLSEAAAEFAAMLDLCEDDNPGHRYSLLPLLLRLGRLNEARTLLSKHSDEEMPVFSWCRALERFLSGDLAEARRAVDNAKELNPHLPAFLLGRKPVPKTPPYSYCPGEESEAQCFAADLKDTWKAHPAAVTWLRTTRIQDAAHRKQGTPVS